MEIAKLFFLALAPGTAVTLYIYLKDKHEREPLSLLLISFFYGALSTLLTLVVSFPVHALLVTKPDSVLDQFINAFFKVALIEEAAKYVFARFILYRSKHFNEPFDGIVYAVMVSMGFATLENIIYVFQFGFYTGLLRMVTAVPAHAVFAIMMGYFLGFAKFKSSGKFIPLTLALLVPTLFHGSYDYFLFIAEIKNVFAGIWLGSLVALVIGFVLSRKAMKIHQQLSPFRKIEDES